MTSPDELFSNLEVTGQPYAALMRNADIAAGILLLAAFVAAWHGRSSAERGERLAMLAFAAAGSLGGLFPEACTDGISAACRRMEWRFELPAAQYMHDVAGILEFAAVTIALASAVIRTRRQSTAAARSYRRLAAGAAIAYPLLGASYLVNRMGGVMEAVFFTGFTIMVVTVLADWTRRPDGRMPDQAVVGSLPHVRCPSYRAKYDDQSPVLASKVLVSKVLAGKSAGAKEGCGDQYCTRSSKRD
jgi:Protein of unknown function (DUF998)